MPKKRDTDLRSDLIRAGIDEINTYGANDFSVRRVAKACNVSTAAPYRHFADKNEFISAIIDYVNAQWAVVQDQALARCSQDPKTQMVEAAAAYFQFLMEKPVLRQVLMLKNADFDNLYHRRPGEINSRTQQIMIAVKDAYDLSDDVWARKVLQVRSLLFGTVFLIDCGEFIYNEKLLDHVRYLINQTFETP